MKQPIILITEVDDGTIYFESGFFESEAPGEKLQEHIGQTFKSLTKVWKHKSEIHPIGNPIVATKYLHRLHRRIPGVFECDRQGGRYRLSPLITIARIM